MMHTKFVIFAEVCFALILIIVTSAGIGAFILNTFFPDKIAGIDWYMYPGVGFFHTISILSWIAAENQLHRRRMLIWKKCTFESAAFVRVEGEIVATTVYLIIVIMLVCGIGFVLGSINVREQTRFDICNTIFMSSITARLVLELAIGKCIYTPGVSIPTELV